MPPFALVILNKVKELCIFPLASRLHGLHSLTIPIEVNLD